jgi:uncharacterized protein (DUF2249 family)
MDETSIETTQARAGCGCGGCGCGGGARAQGEGLQIGSSLAPGDLDVRGLPREERHARIFGTFGELAPGESFVLANDHDPVPLRAKLEAVHLGELAWEYLAEGPALWRVQITKVSCC